MTKKETLDYLQKNIHWFSVLAEDKKDSFWDNALFDMLLDYHIAKSIPESNTYFLNRITLLEKYGLLKASSDRFEQIFKPKY